MLLFFRNTKKIYVYIFICIVFFFITAVYCPQDSVGVFTNTATYPPGPYNLTEEIPLSCSVAGQTFSWSRYCVYNRLTDTYELQGSPYDCGSKYTNNSFPTSVVRWWPFKLCKQFGSRTGPTKCLACSGAKLFDALMLFLKECFWKSWFWKKSADDKKGRIITQHAELIRNFFGI